MRTLELFHPAMREHAGGFAAMAIALDEALAQPKVLVLRGPVAALTDWQRTLARVYLPDTTSLALQPGLKGLPTVLDKPVEGAAVNGWLCRGVTCLAPISALEALRGDCKAVELR